MVAVLAACVVLAVAGTSAAFASDPPSYAFQFGSAGSADGRFDHPLGVAIQPGNGDVYVADQLNHRIERFNAAGVFQGKFGTAGTGDGQLQYPHGAAVSPLTGDVYVAEFGNNRVQEFTAAGGFVRTIGSPGTGSGELDHPRGVAIDPQNGDLLVADSGNNRIQRFTDEGVYKSQFGGIGTSIGDFNLPFAVAVDPADGDIFVTDAGNDRVQKFDSAGTHPTRFDNGTLDFPDGVAVDPVTGHVYIADGDHNLVQEYGASGTFLSQFGSLGTGDGQFDDPTYLAVAPATGNLYVADYNNARVQVFTPPPPVCQSQTESVLHNGSRNVALSCTNPSGRAQTLEIVGQPAHGTLGTVSQATGTVTYTPDTGYAGPDSLTFRSLGTQTSNTATVTLNVAAGDQPTCADGSKSLPAGGSANLVLSCAAGGDPFTFAVVSAPAHGTLGTINQSTGAVTYTPDAGYNGPDQFSFHATSDFGSSATTTYSLTVTPPPTCADQTAPVLHNGTRVVTLSCTNPSGVAQALEIVGEPAHGALSDFTPANATSATVTYTPTTGYAGPDSFSFRSAGTQTSNTATVTLNVAAGPDPTCQGGARSLKMNASANLVLACEAGGDPFTIAVVAGPGHGTLGSIDQATGAVTYTPTVGFSGPDQFTFHATSGSGTSATATFSLTVTPPPACADQPLVPVSHNQAKVVTLSCTNPGGGAQALGIVAGPAHGALGSINPSTGAVTYTPDAGSSGQDSFTFRSTGAETSNTATVTLNVAAGTVPTCQDGSRSLKQGSSAQLVLSCAAGGDAFTFVIDGATHGAVGSINQSTGAVTYTPAAGYSGPAEVSYHGHSAFGDSAIATFTLTITPPPVCAGQTAVPVSHNQAKVVTLSCTNPGGGAQTLHIVTGPAHGTLGSINPSTGAVTYTPTTGYAGPDSFTFRSTGDETSNTATVTLSVAAGPVPTCENGSRSLRMNGSANVVLSCSAGPDPFTIAVVAGPAHGALSSINQATGAVTYTPAAGYSGPDQFTFHATSGSGTSVTATFSLNITPPPACAGQTVAVLHNEAKAVTLSCTNPGGGAQALAIVAQPAHGTLGPINQSTGAVTYTPNTGSAGQDSFSFRSAGDETSNTATVTLNVAAGPDPTCEDGERILTVDNAADLTLTCEAGGDPFATTVVSGPAHGTLGTIDQATGAVTYTPDTAYQGPDEFTFHATSGSGTSVTATYSLTVTPLPVCDDDTAPVPHNGSRVVTLGCSNPPGGTQTVEIVDGPAHGGLSEFSAATRTVRYTPNAGYSGPDSFSFHSVGSHTTNTATVTLNVASGVPPACQGAAKSLPAGSSASLALECSASGDPFTLAIVSGPAHGTLSSINQSAGTVSYTPAAGYSGADRITFRATSAFGSSATATYALTVNAPPVTSPPPPTVVPGRDAVVKCKVTAPRLGKVKVKRCKVSFTVASTSRSALVTLTRGGNRYARLRESVHGGHVTLTLHPTARVKTGRYAVTLVVTDAGGKTTRTVRRVKLK